MGSAGFRQTMPVRKKDTMPSERLASDSVHQIAVFTLINVPWLAGDYFEETVILGYPLN